MPGFLLGPLFWAVAKGEHAQVEHSFLSELKRQKLELVEAKEEFVEQSTGRKINLEN